MPEGRFYEDYIEQNKKQDTKKIKKKINNRVILAILVLILLVYLIVVNVQNRSIQKEESLSVETAKSVDSFEEKELKDGSKIKIDRITIKGHEGIAYIKKETKEGKQEQLSIDLKNISELDNQIIIKEEGLSIKVDLINKTIEEIE